MFDAYVGSEKHYLRAIDTRGRELSKKAFGFNNDEEGFDSAKKWMAVIAAEFMYRVTLRICEQFNSFLK